MRTTKLVLVLLALAVFFCAAVAAADAALQLPGMSAMRPMVAPITQLNSAGGPAQSLEGKSISETNYLASNAVKSQADKMTRSTQLNIAQGFGKTSNLISLPGMSPVAPQSGMRQMPAAGGLNMPDWTSPGIIFTL